MLVFANGEAADIAKRAGADYIGDDDLIRDIEGGWVGFDVGLAIPDMMSKIGKLGRVLGRKGLMPNPRTGTMIQAQDIPRAIEEAKKGRVEYRMDRSAIIHVSTGKVSFSTEQLVENIKNHIVSQGSITVADARTMFDTSRKYILPLLEYLDQQRITQRIGDERVLR